MPIEPWTSRATIACPWMTKQRDDNIIYPWMTKQRDDSIIYTSFVLPYLEFLLLKKILNTIILREKSIFSSSSTVLNHLRNMYSSRVIGVRWFCTNIFRLSKTFTCFLILTILFYFHEGPHNHTSSSRHLKHYSLNDLLETKDYFLLWAHLLSKLPILYLGWLTSSLLWASRQFSLERTSGYPDGIYRCFY